MGPPKSRGRREAALETAWVRVSLGFHKDPATCEVPDFLQASEFKARIGPQHSPVFSYLCLVSFFSRFQDHQSR